MKKLILLMMLPTLLIACNNSSKDTVEKADSTNKANLDTALNNNAVVVDENSSSFIVRVANSGMAETAITSSAREKAAYEDVKGFAGMLYRDHTALNQQVKDIAAKKNIVLPATMTEDKQKQVDELQKNTGKNYDKEFVKAMIKNHEAGIDMFQKAVQDAKDTEIRDFADKTIPILRAHLDSAKALQKKYW
jgi:putative membrane protein